MYVVATAGQSQGAGATTAMGRGAALPAGEAWHIAAARNLHQHGRATGQRLTGRFERHGRQARGLGGFVRATWGEVTEIIAAANAYSVTPLTLRTGCEESM